MRTFTARYRSGCLACEQIIHEGDEAKYDVDDNVIHADCHVIPDRPQDAAASCDRCWQIPASNGKCGCEDLP